MWEAILEIRLLIIGPGSVALFFLSVGTWLKYSKRLIRNRDVAWIVTADKNSYKVQDVKRVLDKAGFERVVLIEHTTQFANLTGERVMAVSYFDDGRAVLIEPAAGFKPGQEQDPPDLIITDGFCQTIVPNTRERRKVRYDRPRKRYAEKHRIPVRDFEDLEQDLL